MGAFLTKKADLQWAHVVLHALDMSCVPVSNALSPLLYVEMSKWLLGKNCRPWAINGTADHIHLIFGHSPSVSAALLAKNLGLHALDWYGLHDFNTMYYKLAWQKPLVAALDPVVLHNWQAYVEAQEGIHAQVDTFSELTYLQTAGQHGLLDDQWRVVHQVLAGFHLF